MRSSRRAILTCLAPATVASVFALPMLASSRAAAAPGPVTLTPPFRLLDSRIHEPDKYDSSARDGLAHLSLAGHEGAVLNVTVTETEGAGFFRLAAEFEDPPATSNVNWWGPGQTLANMAMITVTPTGGFVVQGGGSGRAHLIIDVLGYIG